MLRVLHRHLGVSTEIGLQCLDIAWFQVVEVKIIHQDVVYVQAQLASSSSEYGLLPCPGASSSKPDHLGNQILHENRIQCFDFLRKPLTSVVSLPLSMENAGRLEEPRVSCYGDPLKLNRLRGERDPDLKSPPTRHVNRIFRGFIAEGFDAKKVDS